MGYFQILPNRSTFFYYYSLDFGAGFISLFAGATGMFYVCEYSWHPCRLLYRAEGSLQIPMLIFLGILSISGAMLCIFALTFAIGIAVKNANVIAPFVIALLAFPIVLFLYYIMALIRVTVNNVSCKVGLMGLKVIPELYYGTGIILSMGFGVVFFDFAFVINSLNIEEHEE